jgi:hypothetical protein
LFIEEEILLGDKLFTSQEIHGIKWAFCGNGPSPRVLKDMLSAEVGSLKCFKP